MGTVQEQLAREVEGVARKRLGENAEFSFEVSEIVANKDHVYLQVLANKQ